MGQSTAEIQQRFEDEQSQILEYVDLVSRSLRIDDFVISEINGKLAWADLPAIATRSGSRLFEQYDQQELAALLASLDVVEPRVEHFVEELRRKQDDFQQRIVLHDRYRKEVNDWKVHFTPLFLTSLRTEKEKADYAETMIQKFPVDHFSVLSEAIEGTFYDPHDDEELAKRRKYIGQGFIQAQNNATSILAHHHHEILDWIQRTRSTTKLIANHAPVNLLRQGFLLLMTAFDAAVFDMTRSALAKRFVELAPKFANKDKFDIPAIVEWVATGDLNAAIIDEIIRPKGLQALLRELDIQCGSLADIANGKKRERLTEIVRRRNVHVHKRGFVDEEYVRGVNLDSFKVGDIAAIDEPYFAEANACCSFCVSKLSQWAAH